MGTVYVESYVLKKIMSGVNKQERFFCVEFRTNIAILIWGDWYAENSKKEKFRRHLSNDNTYFMTVLRYILNNPVKSRICKNSAEYSLSSASSYFNGDGITDTAFAENISGRDSLLDFLRTPSDDICMDDTVVRIADRDAIGMIRETACVENPTECALMKQSQLEKLIPKLRLQRLSIYQISRLTGLTVGIIRKYWIENIRTRKNRPFVFSALITPYAFVPSLSVPATSRIFVIDVLKPYCLLIVARQAAPQSVISCCFTQ